MKIVFVMLSGVVMRVERIVIVNDLKINGSILYFGLVFVGF